MALNVKMMAKQISNAFVQVDSVVLPAKMLVGILMKFLKFIYVINYYYVIGLALFAAHFYDMLIKTKMFSSFNFT